MEGNEASDRLVSAKGAHTASSESIAALVPFGKEDLRTLIEESSVDEKLICAVLRPKAPGAVNPASKKSPRTSVGAL